MEMPLQSQVGSSGHSFATLVVEPTETINGFTLHECECGYSYESNPVASLGGVSAANEDSVADTKVYDYVYNGSSLVYLTITTNTYGESPVVETLYFGNGTVTYNGEVYYYVTNLQGDVIAILDDEGNAVVEYAYDAWGNILSTTGSIASTLGVANPLTYRGYVYDTETELYYLQSRYYNPEVGRFINADALVSTGQGFLGNNMFAYCGNNPVNSVDNSGTFAIGVLDYFPVCFGQAEIMQANHPKDSPPNHPDFESPKKGNLKKRNPNGQGYGWVDNKGNVWVWTPNMHGGPGWTVQSPDGGHSHAYPGGGTRVHFDALPEQSILLDYPSRPRCDVNSCLQLIPPIILAGVIFCIAYEVICEVCYA